MSEIWRECAGGFYEVSDMGRVRRLKANNATKVGFVMSQRPDKRSGYATVSLRMAALGQRTCYVHRIVMEAFVGKCPNGLQVNHKNGDKRDNRLDNLEYLTPSQNRLHAYATGLQGPSCGEINGRAKLTEQRVRRMRALRNEGWALKRLAAKYGVGIPTVCQIVNGKRWRHVCP